MNVTAAATVTATFSQVAQTFALTVATAGTGTGSVTSSPAGITCPGTCTNSYASGTAVTLTAAPAAGSAFAGWSGACTNATGTCVVTLNAAQNVTATFNAAPAASFTLALAPAAVSVQAGATATAASTVTLTRTNFTGVIVVAASGAPQGLTVTPNPISVSGTSATLDVAVAATVAPGSYPVSITGTGVGVTQQTATLTVNVTAAPAASFALALAPAAVSVQAGATAAAASTVTLTRTNFTGAVALTTSGAPQGLTVTPNPASVTGTTATLDVAAAATVAPGTYNVTVTGAGTGVTQQTATLAVTVTAAQPAGSFGLAVSPASVSVQQGASTTTTVNVTRANGFTGAVNLAVTGAPQGLTVTPNPASATGGTSTLNITAGATTAPGTYTITVTGTGTGVTQQTATFTVQVTQAPTGGTGNVTFSFTGCDPTQVPIWLAVQNGTGAWTRVTPGANNTFSFTVGTNGGVAYVTQNGTNFNTTVMYGVVSDLTTTANRCTGNTAPLGAKTLTGNVAGLGQTDFASVSVGGATKSIFGLQGTAFTLTNVPDGPRDLIATRASLDLSTGTQALSKVIIRRNTNYPNNSVIPTLDFSSSEAFDPAQGTITVNNLGTDQAFATVSFLTANGASAGFFTGLGSGNTLPYYAVPASQLQPSDIHQIAVIATPPGNTPTSFRYVFTYLRTAGAQTVTLGPSLGATSVTSLATTPYLRLRAQVPSQSNYNGLATASFQQTGHTVTVTQTAAYTGTAPANWTLDIPDLSAAGYDPTWGLRTGAQTTWTVTAVGGDFLTFAGGTPQNNAQIVAAGATGSSSAFIQFLRSKSVVWMRKP
ncbi:beta strand repeat-containing protein [Gemmatirosa kalamazoonensis]|uniref:beta strand repeat-containing protein n=1 Tax=Gemmatirosa kalamazoonensis TaxID=861299 RepID=UPI00191C61AD|nr:hypothetical protein [Gemmatirosa kalamazoonensis]